MLSNSTKLLKVVRIEKKTSPKVAEKMGTEGRYHVVHVETEHMAKVKDQLGQERIVKIPSKKSAFTAWVDSPIEGREVSDFGADLVEGDLVPGDIVTRKVQLYFIPSSNGDVEVDGIQGRYVNTASVVVIGDSSQPDDWEMEILKTFRQRNFLLLEAGDAGAPGGNLDTAMHRERTRMVGHDVRANMPTGMQDASAEKIVGYSDQSAARNQDEGQNAR